MQRNSSVAHSFALEWGKTSWIRIKTDKHRWQGGRHLQQTSDQVGEVREEAFRQLEEAFWWQALEFMGDFIHPGNCWKVTSNSGDAWSVMMMMIIVLVIDRLTRRNATENEGGGCDGWEQSWQQWLWDYGLKSWEKGARQKVELQPWTWEEQVLVYSETLVRSHAMLPWRTKRTGELGL